MINYETALSTFCAPSACKVYGAATALSSDFPLFVRVDVDVLKTESVSTLAHSLRSVFSWSAAAAKCVVAQRSGLQMRGVATSPMRTRCYARPGVVAQMIKSHPSRYGTYQRLVHSTMRQDFASRLNIDPNVPIFFGDKTRNPATRACLFGVSQRSSCGRYSHIRRSSITGAVQGRRGRAWLRRSVHLRSV